MNCAIAFAQEATKQPQKLITEKHKLIATVKLPNGEEIRLRGEAFYQVKEVNSDDTFTGKFVFTLSNEARRLLAKNTTQPIEKIPPMIESENVLAEFENKKECPELHVEFRRLTLALMSDTPMSFERFKLDLNETPQEVSKLLCEYVRIVFGGRGHAYQRLGKRINRLLKGEATEN